MMSTYSATTATPEKIWFKGISFSEIKNIRIDAIFFENKSFFFRGVAGSSKEVLSTFWLDIDG